MSLQSRTEVTASIAAAVSIVPTVLGINAILRPQSALELLEFPCPPAPEPQRLADNLTRLFGAREIFIGLSTLAVYLHGDRKLLGWIMLLGGFKKLADGWVSTLQIGLRGAKQHWSAVPLFLGTAAGLLWPSQKS